MSILYRGTFCQTRESAILYRIMELQEPLVRLAPLVLPARVDLKAVWRPMAVCTARPRRP